AVDVVKLDDGGEIVRQLSQSGADLLAREPCRDFFENHVGVARHEFVVRFFEPRYRHELPATGTPLLAFAQNTAQNAVEPSAALGRVAKLLQAQPPTA